MLVAVAEEFFWLGRIAGDVIVRCRMLQHEGGIAYSSTAAEAYVSSDKVFAMVPYFSGVPGSIYIVAGADCMD